MASQNCESEPDSLPVNGAEQQQADLFQNLEKLIGSAVSICRLDGSVQCQIGGLITVIEELQRLLRHSFAEIRRLEKSIDDQKHTSTRLEENVDDCKKAFGKLEGNLNDQKHMFTNNITNLHYQVKEVQSNVETLKDQMKEVEKFREARSLQNNRNETVDEETQASLVNETHESCSYGEDVDSGSLSNLFGGLSQYNEKGKKEDSMKVNSETDAADDRLPSPNLDGDVDMEETRQSLNLDRDVAMKDIRPLPNLDKNIATNETIASPNLDKDIAMDESGPSLHLDRERGAGSDLIPSTSVGKDVDMPENDQNAQSKQAPDLSSNDTPHTNPSNSPPNETATSTNEERDNVLRVLRSHSDTASSKSGSSSQDQEKSNRRNHQLINTKRLETNTDATPPSLSPRKSRHVKSPPVVDKSPSKGRGRPAKATVGKQALSRNAAKRTPSGKQAQESAERKITPKHSRPAVSSSKVKKPTARQTKQQKKPQKRSPVRAKIARKSTGNGIKKNAKIIANSRGRPSSPGKTTKNQSNAPPNKRANKVMSNQKAKEATINESPSRGNDQSLARKASPLSEKNPMDKYIDLDFLLNANQHMSELVTDSSREEGTLDTASEAERRHVVDLAKLYGLRVRMGGREGELPVALIKGRESSLPKPGQVDKLLCKMTRAMVIKTQVAKSKELTKKHKLSGNRRGMGSPAKKKRV